MALIPEEIVNQVIDRSDIVETIASYVPLKRAGRNFKTLCPFHHEKTPSFVVNPDKQIFHCFGCGTGGNVVSFLMKHEKMDFPEAIRTLAQKCNVTIPERVASDAKFAHWRQALYQVNAHAVEYYHHNLLFGKTKEVQASREYLIKRGIQLETAKMFRLGLALDQWEGLISFLKRKNIDIKLMEKAGLIIPRNNGKGYYDRFRNRIIFPIFDTRGQCRAFGARTLQNESAKYINSPETSIYTKGHHLYGFHFARPSITEKDSVVIVEGYLDCIVPYQLGVTHIVASLGTALTIEQIRFLRRYTKNVFMLFDKDAAGEAAMLRSLDMLIEEGMRVKIVNLKEGEDPDSFVRKYGVDSFRHCVNNALPLLDFKFDVLKKRYDCSTIEGKAKIAEEMLLTIEKIENSVERQEYIKQLSGKLNVAEEALLQEARKIEKNQLKTILRKSQFHEPFMQEKIRAVEYALLKLILEDSHFISLAKKEVILSDFQDDNIRAVIEKIFELFEKGIEITGLHLINLFKDSSIEQMISTIFTEEQLKGDKNKMFADYIHRIKKDRLKLQMQLLRQQISTAENTGDHTQLETLKKEFNQLIKQS